MAARKKEDLTHPPEKPPLRPRELAARLIAEIPEEEWEKIPADLAINHDYYIYGSPKVEE